MKPAYDINDNFQLAESFVNNTNSNIFLTGKAGSGKTTFLHHIKENSAKKNVVVAPTGVAAINAGGMTIHSFFQIPIGTFVPESSPLANFNYFSRAVHTRRDLLKKLRINTQKQKLIQELELLIIDEVSMVRADLLDAVDTVLRYIRKNNRQPFGGIQVLMIGDLYQLPPVVPDDEKQLLSSFYSSPYFFASKVIQETRLIKLELDKIYRQTDERFLQLLNLIRHNKLDESGLKYLNSFYKPNFRPSGQENYITLCSHHYKANAINDRELKKLPGKAHAFEAIIDGDFNDSAAPVDQTLFLKKGAQIMFVRNDKGESKRYYNGKIGVISEIEEDGIGVSFPGDEGMLYLEQEEWKNIRYAYDETTKGITEKVLGTFQQYPIRLAWAITIHKSQGLTFDRAIIDAGDSFASGQVYVALSRLRSLDGLILHTPFQKESILVDHQVQRMEKFPGRSQLIEVLEKEQRTYLETLLHNSMSWDHFIDSFRSFIDMYKEKKVAHREESIRLGKQGQKKAEELKTISIKFDQEISKLLSTGKDAYPRLSERMNAAQNYFEKYLFEHIESPVDVHFSEMEKKPRMKKYVKALLGLKKTVAIKKQEIRQASNLSKGLAEGKDITGLLRKVKEQKKRFEETPAPEVRVIKPKKGDSKKMSFEMYQKGKSIEEIAKERMLTPGTIESHLLHFIKEGQLDVHRFVSEEKFKKISSELKNRTFDSLSEFKYLMGEDFSYNEIKAVINHMQFINE